MFNIVETSNIAEKLKKTLTFPNLSEQYIVNILETHETFYVIELYPTITNTKRLVAPYWSTLLGKNDIIVGIFSPKKTNVCLEIGGTEVVTMQTDKNNFTYLFDDKNFLCFGYKILKYHDTKMNLDKKILLICAKLNKSFEDTYEFKYKINDGIYYEILNGMFLKTNGYGQEVDNNNKVIIYPYLVN